MKYILASVLIILFAVPGISQDAKSNFVPVRISNMPDKEPPEIKILTPMMSDPSNYKTDQQELVIVGEVRDKSGIKFLTLDEDFMTVNEAGLFTTRIALSEGNNTLRIIAADQRRAKAHVCTVILDLPLVRQ